MEYSVNCYPNSPDPVCSKDIDKVIQSINQIYRTRGFPLPYYLFLDVARWYHNLFADIHIHLDKDGMEGSIKRFAEKYRDIEKRRKIVYDEKLQLDGNYVVDRVARFYRYPLISFTYATYFAYLRQYLNQSTYMLCPKHGHDRNHINAVGHSFLVYKVMMPLFFNVIRDNKKLIELEKIKKVPRIEPLDVYNQGVHLFTHNELFYFPVKRFTSWGHLGFKKLANTLKLIASSYPKNSWNFVSAKRKYELNDEREIRSHMCYGSFKKGSKAIFNINVPSSRCGSTKHVKEIRDPRSPIQYCKLSVSYIYSWNTSYFGNASCHLYQKDKVSNIKKSVENKDIIITGNVRPNNAEHMHHTVPNEVLISDKVINGDYVIECINLNENRLSCISEVMIS